MMSGWFRDALRALGSLKSAVITLTLLSAVLAWGTFFESSHGTPAAQRLIYRSWWFSILLAMLAINLASAALVRYPWKRHQTGFAITHLGIILLLVGSFVGYQFGVDGHITLREGSSADAVVIEQEVVQVSNAEGRVLQNIPLDFEHNPLPATGRRYRLASGSEVEIQQAHANVRDALVVEPGADAPNPALHVRLRSIVAGNSLIDEWVLPRDSERSTVSMGPATLRSVEARSESELATLIAPPKPDAGKGTVLIDVAGKHFELQVEECLGKSSPLGDTGFSADLREYFADFRWDSQQRRPVSFGDQPNNPTVLLQVHGGKTEVSYFLFADHPEMTIAQAKTGDANAVAATYRFVRAPKVSEFIVVAGPGERVHYVIHGSKGQFKAGELKRVPERREVKPVEFEALKKQFTSARIVDKDEDTGAVTVETGRTIWGRSEAKDSNTQGVIETGLADWQLEVLDYIAKAKTHSELQPAPVNAMDGRRWPALKVALRKDGRTTAATWVRWGQPTSIGTGAAGITLTYGWQMEPLGFTIRLNKFQAKRYEGTDTPADFRSSVTIEDASRGIKADRQIWMNNPTVYPDNMLGMRGFKFSQASYHEAEAAGEPSESTLGVMWDPGWPLKLLGYCVIILGIFIMYYMKAYFFKRREPQPPAAAARPQPKRVAGDRSVTTSML